MVAAGIFTMRTHAHALLTLAELILAHPSGENTEVDVVPQMQISLSKLQHVLLSVGARVPVNEREGRHPQFLTYVVWDWFEGGFFDFWK